MTSKKSTKTSDASAVDGIDFENDPFKLSPELDAEIRAEGLEYRWINAAQYKHNNGYHRSGWRPYKRKKLNEKSVYDELMGQDPDGFVRYRDSVLAVKTVADFERQRNKILKQNRLLAASVGQHGADALQSKLAGTGARIHTGYDDSDE